MKFSYSPRYLSLILSALFKTPQSAQALSAAPSHRLLTWNLLAPVYAPPQKYPWSDPTVLEWSYRKPRIIQTIVDSRADLVCLQEVQIDLWDEFLADLPEGYTGLVQKQSCKHPVGCALLIRDQNNWKIVETESRSRAFIVVLEEGSMKRRLYLAVVHLEAGSDKQETRWNQVKSLLKRLHNHAQDDVNPAVILAGDFNTYKRDCTLFSVLSGDACEQDKSIASWKGLSHFLLDTEMSSHSTPPGKELLPLYNAHQDNRPTLTYAGGSVLDYIWYSPSSIQIEKSITDWCPLVEYEKENYAEELCPPRPWPSEENPSDHVPIGVDFSLIQKRSSLGAIVGQRALKS